MSLRIDISSERAAYQELLRAVESEARALLAREAPAILQKVQDVTPPSKEGTTLSQAIQRGRTLVAADVYRVVRGVDSRRSRADVSAVMRQHRRQGRVTAAVTPRILVDQASIQPYIAAKQANVGNLARSWTAKVVADGSSATLRFTNTVPYARNVAGLPQRVRKVLDRERTVLAERLMRTVLTVAQSGGLRVR